MDEGRPYKFRVSAENAQGVSVPLETNISVVPKNPFCNSIFRFSKFYFKSKFLFYLALPEAPKEVRLAGQSSETAVLTWAPPSQDGGSKILGYNVEMNEEGSDDWFPVNEALVKGNSFTGRNLFENKKAIFFI